MESALDILRQYFAHRMRLDETTSEAQLITLGLLAVAETIVDLKRQDGDGDNGDNGDTNDQT